MSKKILTFQTVNEINDPRLGCRLQLDPRNRDFPIRAVLPRYVYSAPKTKLWACAKTFNQGSEGSCVGHGFAHELIARPYNIRGISHLDAVRIYKLAQTLDEWPFENYSGTSVLAGVKATQQLFPKAIESYRWAFDLPDVVSTLSYHGPIIVGSNWYQSMFYPDKNGRINISGNVAGRHCYLLRGLDVQKSFFTIRNSWGSAWGKKGDAIISWDDFNRLILETIDLCIPITRGWWKK